MTKDYMYKFRSTIRNKDSKGRDVIKVYLNPEEVQQAINDLTAALESPRGANIVIHTEKKQSEQGRAFDSSFGFIKVTQDVAGARGGATPTKFAPKAKADTAKVAASIRAAKVEG